MPAKKPSTRSVDEIVVELRIADLKPHPRQEKVFGGMDLDIESLATDIETFGLRDPIKVLSDMTIVCGHRRVEAFRRLGRPKIPAFILENMTTMEVDRLLISDNFHRRQLNPLAKARCAAELFELTQQKDAQLGGDTGRGARLEAVAAILGCSVKEVNRYLAVLDAPLEVQRAHENKRVSLVDAGAIGRLADHLKEQAVAAIRAGESPRPIIRQARVERQASCASKMQHYRKLLRSVAANCHQLEQLADCGFAIETLAPQRVSNLTQYIATLNKFLALETLQVSSQTSASAAEPPTTIVGTPPSQGPVGHDVLSPPRRNNRVDKN